MACGLLCRSLPGEFIEHPMASCMAFCAIVRSREPPANSIFCFILRQKTPRERQDVGVVVLPGRSNHIELFPICINLFACGFAIVHNRPDAFHTICRECFTLPRPADNDTAPILWVFRDLARCRL